MPLWQIPRKSQLKGGKIYFDSWFQRVQFIAFGSIDSRPVVRQNIMAAGPRGQASHLIVDSKQRKRNLGSGQGKTQPSRTCPQWPIFSNWHHFPIMSSSHESINWQLCPQDMSLWGGRHFIFKPQYWLQFIKPGNFFSPIPA
jgi:hypothetical protein